MKIPKPKFKLNTIIFQRIGKVLLWTLVVFLIIRGIGSVLRPNDVGTAKQIINAYIGSREYKEQVEKEALSFAEGLSREYLTYQSASYDDYSNRLKKYIPGYLGNIGVNISGNVKAEALSADAIKLVWRSDNQVNVDVRVKVKYTNKTQTDSEEVVELKPQEEIKVVDTYLRVPIVEKQGKYLVEDYPGFIPEPEKGKIEYSFYSGKEVSTELSKNIGGVLENFFKTYYGGNPGEIAYYMLDTTKEVKGLEKRFEFVKLNSVSVYSKTQDSKDYLALVTLTIKDNINRQNMEQRFHVKVVNKDSRYYIDTFDVRVGNLANIENQNDGGETNEIIKDENEEE